MYGKNEEVSYASYDLLWGQGHYQELRFVLVKWKDATSILVSTDLSLSPTAIIELYAKRFKIESMFREMKQQIGGFCYHFWSRSMPKLNHRAKKGSPDPLSDITDPDDQKKILGCIKAIEGFMVCSSIAMGIVQLISLRESENDNLQKLRYLRTQSKNVPSEGTVMYYIRKNIFRMLLQNPHSFVTRFIRERQEGESGAIGDSAA